MSITLSRGRLSTEEVESFNREGLLIYRKPVFPQAKFDALAAHFEKLLSNLTGEERPENMDKPHFVDTALFEWIFADEVLDLVESILGPDIALFATHFICKPRGDGKRVPWHEDSAYWKGLLDPMEALTIWLAIDPASKANGCMYLVPRSHHNGFSRYESADPKLNVFSSEIIPEDRHSQRAIPVELEPNQCSIHDARTIHGSPPNTSAQRRCCFTMRFLKSSTRLDPKFEDRIRLYLARGRDFGVNNFADPEKTYPELYESNSKMYKIH